MYPKSLESLIEKLMILPGVGRKTAERYALHLLDENRIVFDELATALENVKENIQYCSRCHNFAEGELCEVCKDDSRDENLICIVSSPKEIISIEKSGQYKGLYHVLGGLISTRKGIMPDDLNINDLRDRITDSTKEIILALNATVEGETTALYLAKKYQELVPVTRLAFGLSIAGQLDYADDMTLLKAFEGRKKM
jgi:recombination protein RecR